MNKIGKYVANQVLTANPAELVLMLFDEGIRTLKKAEAAFAIETPDRFEAIHNHLVHAQDVLLELNLALDHEKGGDVAANLGRIYDFMLRHLKYANVEKQVQAVTDVRDLLTTLRDAWQTIVEKEQESPKDDSAATRLNFPNNRILAAG